MIDVLDIVPITDEIQSLSTTQHGREFLEDMRDIHDRHPDFFRRLLENGGFTNFQRVSEFEQGNQWALSNIAGQLAFAVKFNGQLPDKD